MNITNEQANYLLRLPKKIVIGNQRMQAITITQHFPFRERYDLLSEEDSDVIFLWRIWQSDKNTLRINLQFLNKDNHIGLLRIDYNGGHANPEVASKHVPPNIAKYAGVRLIGSHIHYYVQGCKNLTWAVPLEDDSFVVKGINNDDFNSTFADIIIQFAKLINVSTTININKLLI